MSLDDLIHHLPDDLPGDTKLGDIPDAREYLQVQAHKLAHRIAGNPMTITDEIRQTNGHHPKGRAVLQPGITLSSGYTVKVNRQPSDIWARAQAAAEADLESERPAIPTQPMETEPGVWKDIPNENDNAYGVAKAAWDARVATAFTEKLFNVMTQIALEFEVDEAKLTSLRGAYGAMGIELPLDDRAAWLSWVIAPTKDDQSTLFMETYSHGLPNEKQVALHRAMFPGDVPGSTA